MKKLYFLIIINILFLHSVFPQDWQNKINSYKTFLENNKNISATELINKYPTGSFKNHITSDNNSALYLDSIQIKFNLTQYENELINNHGFMVTERIPYYGFKHCFAEIYKNDVPVFISTDAILHAFHKSYDNTLKRIELGMLIDKVEILLLNIRNEIESLNNKYKSNVSLLKSLKDVDVYIDVALKLLTDSSTPFYSENQDIIDKLLSFIEKEAPSEIKLFSDFYRLIDFSQFKLRGHYTDLNYPELGNYFKCMMWLGRTEIYLISPKPDENKVNKEDLIRQSIMSYLILELIENSQSKDIYDEIELAISLFVGKQDNVTLDNLIELKNEIQLNNIDSLVNENYYDKFANKLLTKSYAFQNILSQILISNPQNPEIIKPASAFMLFGQRFVIDSYVTGNVVYDKINYNGEKIIRDLPSSLDILYALGNNASAILLRDELEKYKYSPNLLSLRYLLDNHDDEFWNSSIYNSWLNSLKTLNPPEKKDHFPEFMQTGAWWQQKMNTQLASWIELRHDNLLYAKQSYSGGYTCFYPHAYVEPIPEFYNSLKNTCQNLVQKIDLLQFNDLQEKQVLKYHFNYFSNCMDTLSSIANKELLNLDLSENEDKFTKSILREFNLGCTTSYDGWYVNLFLRDISPDSYSNNFITADYHTAPGNGVGWVKHGGTGLTNLGIFAIDIPGKGKIAFAGPMYSYHEFTTSNYLRLSDENWFSEYLNLSARPEWVNLYLADKEGKTRGTGVNLVTKIEEINGKSEIPESFIIAQNYPNPFNISTTINFTVPQNLSNKRVKIIIYDLQGRIIKELINENLSAGNYLITWDGNNENGNIISSGIYFYQLNIFDQRFVGKMTLMK